MPIYVLVAVHAVLSSACVMPCCILMSVHATLFPHVCPCHAVPSCLSLPCCFLMSVHAMLMLVDICCCCALRCILVRVRCHAASSDRMPYCFLC
ncbi:hypothetical protein F5H01DRAFT_65138 [Linnemannia elongata]|nr:hypothetical protein F5H01DRAFT_65138 [Linnemannia elongata]